MSASWSTRLFCGAALSAIMIAQPSVAQSDQATQPVAQPDDGQGAPRPANDRPVVPAEATEVPSDIVVTGTLIRGTAPTGQQLNVVTADDIKQLGAANTSEVLAVIPQDANFNNRPQVGSYGAFQTVNSPRLRYLGNGTAASASTLLLVDGARLPGMGVQQTSSDIDTIPIGAIRRIDIATDGGSATYGADAVGGVVNLITRQRFNGVELSGHFGGAANYRNYDVGGTVGKSWSNGSIWATYQYAHNDLIRNYDRDYVHALDYSQTPPVGSSTSCNPGNFSTSQLVFLPDPPYYQFINQVYPIANGAPVISDAPVANRCDLSRGGTFFPSQDRHTALVGMNVDLSDRVTFDIKAYYTHRLSVTNGGVNTYGGVPGTYVAPDGTVYTGDVTGNFESSLGTSTIGRTKLSAWAIIPRVTVKLGGDFQLTTFLNVGEGRSEQSAPNTGGDPTALNAAATAGLFDPFTGLFANTPEGQAAQAYQANFYSFSSGRDEIENVRSVLDGPLFRALGGDFRVAIGAEYFHERFSARTGKAEIGDFDSIAKNDAKRNVKSAFGELSLPIVGDDNRFGGIYALTLSAAARYDDYSDFGDTFNPKFGVSLKPIESWTIRGNWGKSFQAPSLAASADAVPPAVVAIPAGIFGTAPGYPETAGKTILLLFPGGGLNLRPQKARTWEIGTDFRPTFVPGLTLSATYYNIDFDDQISTTGFFLPTFYTLYPNSYVINDGSLTSQQVRDYIAAAYNSGSVSQYVDDPSKVYALENGLTQNLSRTKTSGIDFNVGYDRPTSFGSLFGSFAGTYILTYKTAATASSPFQSFAANGTIRFQASTSVGATLGPLLAKATWNHTSPYLVTPFASTAFQSRVAPFNLINLAFQYTPKTEGVLSGSSLTFNIDNILDQDPPSINQNNGYSGFTLGRAFTVGVTKKF